METEQSYQQDFGGNCQDLTGKCYFGLKGCSVLYTKGVCLLLKRKIKTWFCKGYYYYFSSTPLPGKHNNASDTLPFIPLHVRGAVIPAVTVARPTCKGQGHHAALKWGRRKWRPLWSGAIGSFVMGRGSSHQHALPSPA